MALLKRFVEVSLADPEAVSIIDDRESVTRGDLLQRTVALSLLIRAKDQSPTGYVGIFLPNCSAFAASYFGAMFAGKTAVPMNVLLQPEELAYIIGDAEIRLILTISLFKPLFELLAPKIPDGLEVVYLDELTPPAEIQAPPMEQLIAHERPEDVAAVLYTSGTTGKPKGVMLTYENLEGNSDGCAQVFEFHKHGGMCIGVLPLFHSYGMMATLVLPLLEGAKIVMVARFQPGAVAQRIVEHKIPIIILVPPMYGLLARVAMAKGIDFSFVQLCVSGGAGLPDALADAWRNVGGGEVMASYGLTEAAPVVCCNHPDHFVFGSIGRPLPNVKVEIRNTATGKEVPRGEEGEICCQGPNVMKGYHKLPDATAEVMTEDGFLRTGDLGTMDDNDIVRITGRAKDLIIFAGENIMPLEIENALASHPEVAEVSVVGLPDESKGEIPVAAIVPMEGTAPTNESLRDFIKGKIADFKIPREFHLVEALPKNALNKVQKKKLVELLQGH